MMRHCPHWVLTYLFFNLLSARWSSDSSQCPWYLLSPAFIKPSIKHYHAVNLLLSGMFFVSKLCFCCRTEKRLCEMGMTRTDSNGERELQHQLQQRLQNKMFIWFKEYFIEIMENPIVTSCTNSNTFSVFPWRRPIRSDLLGTQRGLHHLTSTTTKSPHKLLYVGCSIFVTIGTVDWEGKKNIQMT